MAADYNRGEMDISEHQRTFGGVMQLSVTSGLLTAVVVLFLTLAFATGTGWFAALTACVVVGAVGGFAVKRGLTYYIMLGGLTVIAGLSGLVIAAFSAG